MKKSIQKLKAVLAPLYDSSEASAIIELVVKDVTGYDRTTRLMHADEILPEDKRQRMEYIAARLQTGEPVQYVLGYETFCGRRFAVNKNVLIPRPETAELVHWIVENSVDNLVDNPLTSPTLHILDIGTGSGSIGVSLAGDIHRARVTAVDLSTAALKTASSNAEQLGIKNIRFARMDILSTSERECSTTYQQVGDKIIPIPKKELQALINRVDNSVDKSDRGATIARNILDTIRQDEGFTDQVTAEELAAQKYDIIVSNPPYVREQEAEEIESHVFKHEPSLALFVSDTDPMLFYRAIARYGRHHLNPEGHIYFEINAELGEMVADVLRLEGYHNILIRQDFMGRDRMARATFAPLHLE